MERQVDHAAGDRRGRGRRRRRRRGRRKAADVAAGRQAQEPQKVVANGQAGQETQEKRVRALDHPRRRTVRIARVELLQVQKNQLVEYLLARTLGSVNNNNNIIILKLFSVPTHAHGTRP